MDRFEVQLGPESSAILTLRLSADELAKSFETLLAKYQKEAQIKGFRKGKVPRNVLMQKYGEGIRHESMFDALEAAYKEIEPQIEPKPIYGSQPQLQNEKLEYNAEGMEFQLTYDVEPQFEVEKLEGFELSLPKTSVEEHDIVSQIERLQTQNAMFMDSEGPLTKDAHAWVDAWEIDAEGVKTQIEEDERMVVGSETGLYAFDGNILGMMVGETREFEKSYADDYRVAEFAGKTKKLEVKLNKMQIRELPELDDEFAQDINEDYKTLDDLKKAIRENMEKAVVQQTDMLTLTRFIDEIAKTVSFDIPKSLVRLNVEAQWNQMLQQYGFDKEMAAKMSAPKEGDEMFEEMATPLREQIRATFIRQKVVDAWEIKVSAEERDEHIKSYLKEGADLEEAKKELAQAQQLGRIMGEVEDKKLIAKIRELNTLSEGEALGFEEFMGLTA